MVNFLKTGTTMQNIVEVTNPFSQKKHLRAEKMQNFYLANRFLISAIAMKSRFPFGTKRLISLKQA
jgi:hypothetical protein